MFCFYGKHKCFEPIKIAKACKDPSRYVCESCIEKVENYPCDCCKELINPLKRFYNGEIDNYKTCTFCFKSLALLVKLDN